MVIETDSFKLAVNIKGNPNSNRIALVLPGRLDTKDYICFDKHIEYLASKGFYAVSFDPPGTWGSPGVTELFTTTNYIKATNELIGYFGSKPTILLGHSRGGAVATLAGTTNPNVIGLILINPSLGSPTPPNSETLKAGVYIADRDLPPGSGKTEESKRFESSLIYFEDGQKYDDSEVLKTCTKPKIIFCSIGDEYNPPEYVKEVFNSIPEPKEFRQVKGKHNYRYYPDVIEEVNREIGLFVDKYFAD